MLDFFPVCRLFGCFINFAILDAKRANLWENVWKIIFLLDNLEVSYLLYSLQSLFAILYILWALHFRRVRLVAGLSAKNVESSKFIKFTRDLSTKPSIKCIKLQNKNKNKNSEKQNTFKFKHRNRPQHNPLNNPTKLYF